MNDFDKKWLRCVAQARLAPVRESVEPPGFVTRLLAARRKADESTSELVWLRLTRCWLAGTAAVLVICAALELPHLRDKHPFNPGVENTVAQLLWRL